MYSRLRELRVGHGMTQVQIAKHLNMSQTGYSQYEIGRNDIPTIVLIKLATFYKVSVDYLLDLTNESKPYKRA